MLTRVGRANLFLYKKRTEKDQHGLTFEGVCLNDSAIAWLFSLDTVAMGGPKVRRHKVCGNNTGLHGENIRIGIFVVRNS